MDNLKNLRKKCGKTQMELAKELGVNRSAVACWELGIKYPSADKLPALAKIFGCTIDELFTGTERAG